MRGAGSRPAPARKLILASASPRRKDLLAGLGIHCSCRPVEIDETPETHEHPDAYVRRLARDKALAARAGSGELVIAADTVVALAGRLLGKPTDRSDARRMLGEISGRRHEVFTGIAALAPPAPVALDVVRTSVDIATLTDADITWYVATGEPLDKAGSYAIQGLGALFVESVTGNYSNVVGLPLPALQRLVHGLGMDLRDFRGGPSPRT